MIGPYGNWYPDPVPPAGLLPPYNPGGGSDNDVTGPDADPNVASVVPADPTKPAFYYQDNAAISLWMWSPSQQLWLGIITP